MTTGGTESTPESGASGDADELAPALPVGTTVGGKYVVQQVIGSGGNGRVYEATHGTIGHRVAIKVVHARLSGRTEVVARLGREARICASLRHPNIGQVYDVGSLEDGVPYLVMELQEGLSLAEILADTTLSVAAIVAIGRQLLAGLAAAHACGVIHRDVKPDNVMVVRELGGEVAVKLVDFGIAKHVDLGPGGNVTRRGVLVGSPDYMAPEQLRGEVLDCRTDVYGVGVVLYEALTGRTPFDGQSVADLFASILHSPVEPPIAFRPDCPPELQLLVLSALSRDPAQRPPNAEQMARALELVPVGDSQTGMTLAELHERLGRRARESPVVVRQPRMRNWTDVLPHARDAPRRWQATALRAVATCVLGFIAVPVLIAARDATWRELAGSAGPPRHASMLAPAQPRAPSSSISPIAPVDSAATGRSDPPPPVRSPDSGPADRPLARDNRAAEASAGAATPRSSSRARAATHPVVPDRRAVAESAARTEGAVDEPQVQDQHAIDELLERAATTFVRGDAARARELYLQALARDPQRPEALRGLGLALNRMFRNAEAVRAFERYLARRPDAPDASRIREMLAQARARAEADELRALQMTSVPSVPTR